MDDTPNTETPSQAMNRLIRATTPKRLRRDMAASFRRTWTKTNPSKENSRD